MLDLVLNDSDQGQRASRDRYLLWGGALSLVLHIILFAALQRAPLAPPAREVFEVEFVTEPPQQKQREQMVSPSESASKAPPLNTRLLSERDSSVEKEQLKRGDGLEAGPVRGAQPGAPAPETKPAKDSPKSQPQRAVRDEPQRKAGNASPPKAEPAAADRERASLQRPLKQLSLDNSTLLEKFGASKESPPNQDRVGEVSPARYRAFSRPAGSGAAFLGATGSSDFIPSLPDGDITLLNAKASKFAVFVRRVATQVFGRLRQSGWETLRASDIQSMGDFSTVEAVLNLKGELESVTLHGKSGSERFDRVLSQAVQGGAKDGNPPADAVASDGRIHFIFKARSWSQPGADPRTGAPFERRWLLLQTGLE
jgi:hypothetical protein